MQFVPNIGPICQNQFSYKVMKLYENIYIWIK